MSYQGVSDSQKYCNAPALDVKDLALEQRLSPLVAIFLEVCAWSMRRASTRCMEELKGKLDADSGESTEILPSFRRTNSQVAKEVRPFSGGHDFLRLFGTPLAANRGGPANNSFNTTACVCRIRNPN
jgi:hypothetical protein